MAYTRIHAIRTTVGKSITYICNPEKTDDMRLVSSYSCVPESAEYDFRFALSKTRDGEDKNLAYHLVQSFAPEEITPEEAHQIGEELASKLLKGNHSYVIATHTDKASIHNHIVFCAADNFRHKKFNSCRRSYYQIRNISDELCKEHNLSIIAPSKNKGKTYIEWKAIRAKNSWKEKMRQDIDEVIETADSYEEFLSRIREKGYEVKGEKTEGETLKYISFRAPGQQRFVRGSERSLGAKYTRDEIFRQISEKKKIKIKTVRPHQQDILKRTATRKTLIDTSADKIQKSPGLKYWADVQNLKTAAASYAEAGNLTELKEKIDRKSREASDIRSELNTVGRELRELKEIQYYLLQYNETAPYRQKYNNSKDKEDYAMKHDEELTLFDGARNKLKQLGIRPNISELRQVNSDVEELENREAELEKKYESAKKEAKDLEQKYRNIIDYFGIEKDREAHKKKHDIIR